MKNLKVELADKEVLRRISVIDKFLKSRDLEINHKAFWIMKNGCYCVPDFESEKTKIIDKQHLELVAEQQTAESDAEYEGEGFMDNSEKVKAQLVAAGVEDKFNIVVADDYTLQIDVDTTDGLATYIKNIPIVIEHLNVASIDKTISKSDKIHITIKMLSPMDVFKRIALQAVLGSDSTRETCNIKNVLSGKTNTILFVEQKDQWNILL